MKPHSCDIAVVGAGSAGIAAAIAAARRGASVCVIERSATVGGHATDAMVGTICGLSLCGPASRQLPQYDNPGFASDFGRRIASASGTTPVTSELQLTYLPYRIAAFEYVAKAALESIDSISRHLSTNLISLERSGERGDFLLCLSSHSDSTTQIRAQAVIDASGDAIVSSYLKLSTIDPNPPQAAALVFELSGLPSLDERTLGFTMRKILREASAEGALAEHLSYLSLVPGSLQAGRVLCKLGVAPLCESAAEAPLDIIYTKTMDSIPEILLCLCDRAPLFCATRHTRTAPKLGVRSGRRGVGEVLLEDDGVLFSKPDPSGVALGLWPVEAWNTPLRPEIVFPQGCGAYEIPFGSLCAKEMPGVYFAGRTISASDKAIASARVIGTCLSTGYAAGSIAAGTIQGETRSSLISSLREEQISPFYEVGIA
jgi:hypothetical protein